MVALLSLKKGSPSAPPKTKPKPTTKTKRPLMPPKQDDKRMSERSSAGYVIMDPIDTQYSECMCTVLWHLFLFEI